MIKKTLIFVIGILLACPTLAKHNIEDSSFVGDGLHTEIYTFIGEAIIAGNKKTYSEKELKKWSEEETKIFHHSDTGKPHSANMSEGENAHLLGIICKAEPKCFNLVIYNKQGVGLISGDAISDFNSTKLNNREKGLNIGILDKNLLSNFRSKTYVNENGEVFTEYLKPVISSKLNESNYFSFTDDYNNRSIVGYISYIFGPYKKLQK